MKEQVSSAYINKAKEVHAHKPQQTMRRCIVTGVSKDNIGEAICNRLVAEGFKVFPHSRGEHNGPLLGDLTHNEAILQMLYRNSDIDTIILSHAIASLSWIEDERHETIARIIDVNLISNMKIISEFADMMMTAPYRKTIIVIGSLAGTSVVNGSAPYCASKAGLQHYMQCVAWELTPKGFDVYTINPTAVVGTPMTERIIADLAEFRGISQKNARDYWGSSNPRGEFLTRSEIAKLVYHIADEKFPYLCGSQLDLRGGQR